MKTLDGIKKLNAVKKADGELLIEAIDLKELKGAKEKDLAEAFLTAIEGIPEKDEQFIPEELAELYNKLAEDEETVPEPETKETAKPAAKAAKKPESVTKKVPAKVEAKKAPVKAEAKSPKGELSRKQIVYKAWMASKKKATLQELFGQVKGLKESTIKSWLGQWIRNKNLPASVK
jgi:hypothetical protein